jgi:hypothetical protein
LTDTGTSARISVPRISSDFIESLPATSRSLSVIPTNPIPAPSTVRVKASPLLEEHHDKIQALLDKNPTASRQALGPKIHDISDETHRKIHALLTDHQKELEKAMQQHEQDGEENRRSAPPAAASPEPSSSPS